MDSHRSAELWSLDFAAGLATCAGAVLRFEREDAVGVKIAFVRRPRLSLEAQCLLAGQAVAEIERAYRLRRLDPASAATALPAPGLRRSQAV